jgi:putative protein kinase ArgK-like GTPase of G3E family
MEFQLVDASRYLITDGRRPPVLKTSALKDEGVDALADEILAYQKWLAEGERLHLRRKDQAKTRIRELVRSALEENFWTRNDVETSLAEAAKVYQSGEQNLVEVAQKFWLSVRGGLLESDIQEASPSN